MPALELFWVVCGGLLAAYFGLRLNLGPMTTHRKLSLWSGFLLGLTLALGLGGVVATLRISQSPRPTEIGRIRSVDMHRGSHGDFDTSITVITTDGRPLSLRIQYHGPHLYEGLPVAVTYLAAYDAVLKLKSLEPDGDGWTDDEDDGLLSAKLSVVGGIMTAITALALLIIRNRYPKSSRFVY